MLQAQEIRAIKWKNTTAKGSALSFFHDFHRNCRNYCSLNVDWKTVVFFTKTVKKSVKRGVGARELHNPVGSLPSLALALFQPRSRPFVRLLARRYLNTQKKRDCFAVYAQWVWRAKSYCESRNKSNLSIYGLLLSVLSAPCYWRANRLHIAVESYEQEKQHKLKLNGEGNSMIQLWVLVL